MSFHSTLSFLSAELEGRSYGGGVLKLEPTEAERVRIIKPDALSEEALRTSWKALDKAARARDFEGITKVTDEILLGRQLGLSDGDIEALRAGAKALRERRAKRNRKAVS